MILVEKKKQCRKTGAREWSDVSFNIQTGCEIGCYPQVGGCWACKHAIQYKQVKDYQEWIHPREQGKKTYPHNQIVMFPSTHNLNMQNLPRFLLESRKLLGFGNKLLIVEKPWKNIIHLIIEQFEKWNIDKDKIEFRFSITSASDEISLKYETWAPLPQERVECLKMVLDAGFPTSVSMEPYLEDPINIGDYLNKKLYRTYDKRTMGCLKEVWVGRLNYHIPPELKHLYTREFMECVYNRWHDLQTYIQPNIRWKDSFQRVLGIDQLGNKKIKKSDVSNKMRHEFEYVMSISETLEPGKWIAVVDKDVINGDSAKEVLKEIKQRHPSKEPFIMKVPENSVMLL
jgi:hypothetical protein